MPHFIVAVDIGGTKITASLVNKEGIKAKVFQLTQKSGKNTVVPQQIDCLITYLINKNGIKKEDIKAVGISSAGPFKKLSGMIGLVTPNICGGLVKNQTTFLNQWTFIPLEQWLTQKYPKIVIQNDCVSATQAEKVFGLGQNEKNFAYVTWSTGIGAGAFVDGRLLSGKNGNALHFGHTLVEENSSWLCGCGVKGHLEALIRGQAIKERYGKNLEAKEVFALYCNGDKKAQRVIGEVAMTFGKGLVSLNAILDLRLIILGGSIFLNNQKTLLPIIKKSFQENSFSTLAKETKIMATSLGKALGDLSALSLVMPKSWKNDWIKNQPWKKMPKMEILD